MVAVIRNREITNWNKINHFLNPPPEDEKLKPDFKTLICFTFDKITAGYEPAVSATIKASINNDTSVTGLNKTVPLNSFPDNSLKKGSSKYENNKAKTTAISVKKIDSLMNWLNSCAFLAPSTFLIPISFLLFCAVNAAKPNKPRHEITMANPAKYVDNADTLVSESYCF